MVAAEGMELANSQSVRQHKHRENNVATRKTYFTRSQPPEMSGMNLESKEKNSMILTVTQFKVGI